MLFRSPVLLQAVVFVDAAAASRADRVATRHADMGVGVRVRVPGEGTLRVDYGRGLTDARHAVSVGWELPWPSWP